MTGNLAITRRSAMGMVAGAGLAIACGPAWASEPELEILAEGLAFPEGPVVMPDGSVVLVELLAGKITRVWNGRKEVISEIGGGPNGAQIGPDGALYVCNNGGVDPANSSLADPSKPGRVERLDLSTGKVDRLFDQVGDTPLSAPNDLIFDADGGMWFTDYGKTTAECFARGGVYYRSPDGNTVKAITRAGTSFNGIGLSPDGKSLYFVNHDAARLYRMGLSSPGEVGSEEGSSPVHAEFVATGVGDARFDGLAVTQSGNICIGTNHTGGLTTITPDGSVNFLKLPDVMVTNIAFGGKDMRDAFVTLGTTGRLARLRWDEPGLPLNFS